MIFLNCFLLIQFICNSLVLIQFVCNSLVLIQFDYNAQFLSYFPLYDILLIFLFVLFIGILY